MISQTLWFIGSLVILILGTIHLYYTFYSNKFSPRKTGVEEEMKSTSPILTSKTTMWKAWVGFNASHSIGAMFIGFINIYIAIRYFDVIQNDIFFFLFNIIAIAFYVWLAKRYWFKIPFSGVVITLICYLLSFILTHFSLPSTIYP